MTAGLDHAAGDAVIVIDSGPAGPARADPRHAARLAGGADVVLMRRASRGAKAGSRRARARFTAHRLDRRARSRPTSATSACSRAAPSRRCARCPSARASHEGLFAWVGFDQVTIDYQRDARFASRTSGTTGACGTWRSRASPRSARRRSSSPATSDSRPRSTRSGAGVYVFGKSLLFGVFVAGYPSLMVTMLFLGGVQLIALGIIGEYLARMFVEIRAGRCICSRRVSQARRAARCARRDAGQRPIAVTARRAGRLLLWVLAAVVLARLASLSLYPLMDTTEGALRRDRTQDARQRQLAHAAVGRGRAVLGQAAAVVLGQRGEHEGLRRRRVRRALRDAFVFALATALLFWRWPHAPARDDWRRRRGARAAVVGARFPDRRRGGDRRLHGLRNDAVDGRVLERVAGLARRSTAGASSSGWRSACSPKGPVAT